MIRVLLADDQALIRTGLRALLETNDDIEVVAEAGTGTEAAALTKEFVPDVVVMDVQMPERDGIWATQQICSDPSLAGVKVLVLTTFERDTYTFEALRAGASGFLGKAGDPKELADAIRTVHEGGRLLSASATAALVQQFLTQPKQASPAAETLAALTDREREVVTLVGRGLSNDEIAEALFISPLTAKTHVTRAMSKTHSRDRAQLVVLAYSSGPLTPGQPGN